MEPTSLLNGFYSYKTINEIYSLQNIVALLILFTIISSIALGGKLGRLVTSIALMLLAITHYYVLYLMTKYLSIRVVPLMIIETTKYGSTVAIDFGQIAILALAYIWRKDLARIFRSLRR